MTYQTIVVWRGSRPFTPPTDIIELPDRLIVNVEIAGMRSDGFAIAILNRRLTISGRRDRPALTGAYHQAEIGYGDFRVDVSLPWGVIRESVTALYQDGLLRVELPRSADSRIHIVNVQPADSGAADMSAEPPITEPNSGDRIQ